MKNIFKKKENEKEEIKKLIHTIEYCKTYLPELESIVNEFIEHPDDYNNVDENRIDITSKIVETKILLEDARKRLKELGVY